MIGVSLYMVWLGDGSVVPHLAALNADTTLCGQSNRNDTWDWDYPNLSYPMCPACRGKAAEL